jgi:cell division protein FtsW (lipid II flippase)
MSTAPPRTGSGLLQQLAIATNWPILVAVGVLSGLGLLSIWEDKSDPGAGAKQLVFLIVSVLCMALFQAVNYQKLGRFAWGFYIFSLVLIAYTVVGAIKGGAAPIPLVRRTGGAYCWIYIGGYSLEPAELMKMAFIGVMARYLRFRSNYRTFFGLLAPFGLAVVPIMLIMKQPDLGTALTFFPALFAMLFMAGAKIRHLLLVIGLGGAMAPLLWFSGQPGIPVLAHMPQFVRGYQRERVFALIDARTQRLRDVAFQQDNAIAAFGSGGVTGKGVGKMPLGIHVPDAHNDMIFALIGEQFGFMGSAVVLAAYIVLFVAGIEIAASTREPFGRLVAVGIVSLLAGQTFLNLMVTIKLMPVTGITLPFISYGGSSLLASFMAIGLLLNIGQNRPIVMANDAFEFE